MDNKIKSVEQLEKIEKTLSHNTQEVLRKLEKETKDK